ncbi:unnamed protein product [Urochloa humidicola]
MAEWPESSATIIVQLWSDWEIQFYVLLSFVLQIFLFFVGSLRRRNGQKMLVRFPIWLAYLLADLVAVYALGYLSRNVATTPNKDERQTLRGRQTHPLTFFWAPFLLIHLGGQDSTTAFSVEDNELWLRHLLNLLAQVWLALYVFWKSTPGERLAVPAVFVFVAGIIKYGERTWALKSGSENALRSSTAGNEVVKQVVRVGAEANLQYSQIVKCALCSETGVRDVFAGRKLHQLDGDTLEKLTNNVAFEGLEDGEVHFKIVEIELGLMYDELYTKAKVVQTLPGIILRCVSFISMIVAFVLVVTMIGLSKHGGSYSRPDVAITYVLFTGALCLEVCSIFSVMVSPRTWAFLEGRQYHMLARAVWSASACAGLQTRPWWSNSMGQYNFLSSCIPSKPRAVSKVITKIMGLLGAKQLWRNIQNSKHTDVKTGLKDTISTFLGDLQPASRVPFHAPPTTLSSCPMFREIIRNDFAQALLFLHVFTDLFLHKVTPMVTEETRALAGECKRLSDYMFYLLAVQPAMLPVGSNVQDLLTEAMENVKASSSASSKDGFLSALADGGSETDAFRLAGDLFREAQGVLLQQQEAAPALREVVAMWVPLVVYAAGKSRAKEHARRLSMGGDLLTFVWLLMVHRMLGDFGSEIDLWARDPAEPIIVRPDIASIRGFLFEFPTHY